MHQILIYIHQFSYLGIFVLTFFSGYIIPVPEEVVLLTIGYVASINNILLLPTIIIIICAFIISDYVVFKLISENNKLVEKFVTDVLAIKSIDKHKAFFEKNIGFAIFIFRCIPLMRFVGPVSSGYLKVKDRVFLFYNSLANIVCAPILVFAGYFSHRYVNELIDQSNYWRYPFLIILWTMIAFVAIRIIQYLYKMKKAKRG